MTHVTFFPLVVLMVIAGLVLCVGKNRIPRQRHAGLRTAWIVLFAVIILPAIIRGWRSDPWSFNWKNGWFATAGAVRAMPPVANGRVGVQRVPPTTSPTTANSLSKVWVSDWPGFVNSTGWQGFKCESSDYAPTESQARDEALDRAARNLVLIVQNRPEFASQTSVAFRQKNIEMLLQQIAERLNRGEFVSDLYLKPTEKPYGTLWKAYVLIDTSPQSVDTIISSFQQRNQAIWNQRLTTWGSAAGMVLILFLTYLFLNAATKGYFVWKLRAAVVMMLIVTLLLFYGNLRI